MLILGFRALFAVPCKVGIPAIMGTVARHCDGNEERHQRSRDDDKCDNHSKRAFGYLRLVLLRLIRQQSHLPFFLVTTNKRL